MLNLSVTLNNEQVELLDQHLVLHEVALTDHFADGVTRFSMAEEEEVTRLLVILHALRAEIRKHQVYCTEKDREDVRTKARRLTLLRRMRNDPRERSKS